MFHYICLSFEENESFTFRNLFHTFYPKISRNSYYIIQRHCTQDLLMKKLISSSPSNRSNLSEETCGSHFDRRGYTIHSDVHTSEKGSQYVRSHAGLYFL